MRRYKKLRPRNTPSTTKKVVYQTGSEGPKHDPYFYEEFYFEGMTLHLGLGEYLEETVIVNGRKTTKKTMPIDLFPQIFAGNNEEKAFRILKKRFERHAGTTIEAVVKYQNSLEPDPMGCLADYE